MAIEPVNTCSICGLEIKPGQAVHGAKGDHWDCVYPDGAPPSLAEISADLDKKLEKATAAVQKLKQSLGSKPHPWRGGYKR